MLMTRTPFRISLFGGGSDYPAWFERNGGRVIGFSINRYCNILLRRLPPFFEHKSRAVYGRIEAFNSIEEVEHPAIKGVLSEMGMPHGIEIMHIGDLPARSGLGSSSAFTVGLLNALYALDGKKCSKTDLARKAIHIEQNVIGEAVGSQDQIWAAFGGFNTIEFHPNGMFTVNPVIVPFDRREEMFGYFQLYFTGFSRTANDIAKKKIENLRSKEKQIFDLMKFVDIAEDIIREPRHPLGDLGLLAHEAWVRKRELADTVATQAVDEIYEEARAGGALGGKLIGAGGGGFMLLVVPPERQEAVRKRLSKLMRVDFAPDYGGSRIDIYEPQLDYS